MNVIVTPTILDALALYGTPFGQGNGSILERIDCTGSEPRLIDCSIYDYSEEHLLCDHADDVGVRCCK